ncbi:MAG: hypothetical protein IJA34_17670 [Lachnospiraceae bacterium]|nr:hypothetical protein [Lachnospiraceae bacterium]
MNEIVKIIEMLKTAPDDELCNLELELFGLIYDKKKAYFEIECFLTLSNWVGFSLRDGVWTFYEYTNDESVEKVKAYLESENWDELSEIYKLGIHDYHNEKYLEDYNYPNEWIEESEIIDNWIFENEINIYRFLKELVLENEDIFLM